MARITFPDKGNRVAPVDENFQVTAGNLNEIKDSVNAVYDGVDSTSLPIKIGDEFVNSPLKWSGIPGENVISEETIQVPPGTVQIGEGLKLSAAGVVPIFTSLLTGTTYVPTITPFSDSGSDQPLKLKFDPVSMVVVQPDFSAPSPLEGMFTNTVSSSAFVKSLVIKTNALGSLSNVRMQLIAQSTGKPIYYFPSKAKWDNNEGAALSGDASGDVHVDFGDAPLGLLVGEVIEAYYKIDSGVLLGTGLTPYQALTRQVVSLIEMMSVDSSVADLADMVDPGSGSVMTVAERNKLASLEGGRYLGKFADLTALQTAFPIGVLGDTATVTTPNGNMFFWDVTAWLDSGTGYVGDMLRAMYDPTAVDGDAFSMANMAETPAEKILTVTERTTISNQSGVNTGDQDLSNFATIAQINNTTGHANYIDSSTPAAPLYYTSNVEGYLLNDKAILDGARYPNGVLSYWDSANSKFLPDQADGSYAFSVNFSVDAATRDKRLVVKFIAFDAGGPGVDVLVQERLVRLQKDDGDITSVSLSFTEGITAAMAAMGITVTLLFQDTNAEVSLIKCGLTKVGADII